MEDKPRILINGEWYTTGQLMSKKKIKPGSQYLDFSGTYVSTIEDYECPSSSRHILTPCDPPKDFTLGQDIAKHIRDGDVLVANGVVPPGNFLRIGRGNDEFMIQAGRSNSDSATVFLFARPLPPPAPEPKTADDYLIELYEHVVGRKVADNEAEDLLEKIKAFLAEQEREENSPE